MILPFLIHVPLLVFIVVLLNKKFSDEPLKIFFLPGLVLKITAGISIGILYLYYYTYNGDTYLYHQTSSALTQFFFNHNHDYWNILFKNQFTDDFKNAVSLWNEPRALFFIKFLSLLNIITFSNYWINGMYLSLFSFCGLFTLANTLAKTIKAPIESLIFSFLLLPSFVIWTSGLLKEAIVIGCMAFCISYSLKLMKNKKINFIEVLLILITIYIGWKIKYYYILVMLAVLVPMILTSFISEKFSLTKPSYKTALFLFIFSLLILLGISFPILDWNVIMEQIYISYSAILRESHGQNVFILKNFSPTLISFIKHSPEALMNGLFRPFIWETTNFLGIANAIENLIGLALLVSLVYRLLIRKQQIMLTIPGLAAIIYILILATLMAFISPNWGTLSRYKVGYSMLLFLILSWNNPLVLKLIRLFDLKKKKQIV